MLGKGALILAIAGPIVFATSSSHLLKTPEIKFEESITPLISTPATKPIENTEQNIPKVKVKSREEQNAIVEKVEAKSEIKEDLNITKEIETKTKKDVIISADSSLKKPNLEIEIKTEKIEVLKDSEQPKPTSIKEIVDKAPTKLEVDSKSNNQRSEETKKAINNPKKEELKSGVLKTQIKKPQNENPKAKVVPTAKKPSPRLLPIRGGYRSSSRMSSRSSQFTSRRRVNPVAFNKDWLTWVSG